jgi:hypothetical protein
MGALRYPAGEEVKLGDIVDVGAGHGPRLRVVVIPKMGLAAEGFDAREWQSLGDGILLQDVKTGGLVELSEFDPYEDSLVERA